MTGIPFQQVGSLVPAYRNPHVGKRRYKFFEIHFPWKKREKTLKLAQKFGQVFFKLGFTRGIIAFVRGPNAPLHFDTKTDAL